MTRGQTVFALLLACARPLAAQPSGFGAIEKTLRDEMKQTGTPGAAIGIVRGNRLIFARGFGLASAETSIPVTADTLFRLGSTTKMFTAAAVVGLAEEGRLKMDEPIGRYLPGISPCLTRVTASQLLSHTAGLVDDAPMYGSHDDSALARNVLSWKDDYCFTEPCLIFSYSNPGYVLAGYLAETVAGKSYADLVVERLMKPLGMTRSTFRPTAAMTWPLAQGHDLQGKVIRPAADYAGAWPAGSLFSSVNDLARFVIAFLNDGRIDGRQILSDGLIRAMTAAHARTPLPGECGAEYGYGLELISGWFQHDGNRTGYGSTIRMHPYELLGVIVLGNRTGAVLEKTADQVAKAVGSGLGQSDCVAPLTERELAALAGAYVNHGETVELRVNGDDLTVVLGGKRYAAAQTYARSYEFTSDAGRQTITFPAAKEQREYVWLGSRAYKRRKPD